MEATAKAEETVEAIRSPDLADWPILTVPHPLPWASQEHVTHVENRVIELESAVKQCMVSIIRINKDMDFQDQDIRQLIHNKEVLDEALKYIIRAIRLVNRRADILEA
jgi:hypothetical protein